MRFKIVKNKLVESKYGDLMIEAKNLPRMNDYYGKLFWEYHGDAIIVDLKRVNTHRSNNLKLKIEEIFVEKLSSAYKLIIGEELTEELKNFYASKKWASLIVSNRSPKQTEQTALERGITAKELIAQATEELEMAYALHVSDRNIAGLDPLPTLIDYANYILIVATFWKKAEGSLNLLIGTIRAKLLGMIESGDLEGVENILPYIQNLKPSKTATTPQEKFESIMTQSKELL